MEVRILRPGISPSDLIPSTKGSAAYDLRACVSHRFTIEPGGVAEVPTGVAIHIKDPFVCGMLVPRSGLGAKHGIILANTVGLIDSDYQGEISAMLWNRSPTPYVVEPQERVCQLVLVPVKFPKLVFVDQFSSTTDRGDGGFGSTGKV